MASQSKSQGLSKVTKAALLSGESETVDFKRTAESITTEDLVAFANRSGGTIYAGVEELSDSQGVQRGVAIGCDVSDSAKLQVLNKAVSCIPPVAVELHIENLAASPIIRVVIPASASKPHCTTKGIYCRRDGVRNRPLHPTELLKIYLDQEASAFAERFESTADRVTANLEQLEQTLSESIDSMGSQLGWAEYKLGDTESTIDTILGRVVLTEKAVADVETRLRALFRQDDREDPVRDQVRADFVKSIVDQLLNDKALLKRAAEGASLQISAQGKAAAELNEQEIKSAFHDALLSAQKAASPDAKKD